jgi:hypothetical protein
MVFGALASAATAFIGTPLTIVARAGERDIERARGQRLHLLGVAGKRADLEIDAVFFENAGIDADIGGHEGELIGLCLAEAKRRLRGRRAAGKNQRHSKCAGRPYRSLHDHQRHSTYHHCAGRNASV